MADEYPTELEECMTLPDHRTLFVRPLRPGELGTIQELDAHLSGRTRYLRFLSYMPAMPDSILRLLTAVDYRRRLSLVAEYQAASRREVVALGSFSALDDGAAEVALVVRDDWQRMGVGTLLAGRVLRAAADRGFARFVANVLWENVAMRKILKRVGRVVATKSSPGVSEVTFVVLPTILSLS
jgi:RimJ/RimL family protein N-acetyltransferase